MFDLETIKAMNEPGFKFAPVEPIINRPGLAVSVEVTNADWGTIYVANIRKPNDVCLRIGPAYSVEELLRLVLSRF